MNDQREVIEVDDPEQVMDQAVVTQDHGFDENYLKHLDWVATNVDKYVDAKNKIWKAVLRLAKDGDWTVFGSGKSEKVCLSGAGAERIASALGISFTNWRERKEVWTDSIGQAYRYWFECDVSFGGRTMHAINRASSRDKFFGREKGEWKSLENIDESNIKMAAYRNVMKEGVKIMLGIRNIPKEEFVKAGISLQSAGGHDFTNNPSDAKEAECSKCAALIDDKVAAYSKQKFGKFLCRDCQKGVNGNAQ